MAKQKLGLYTNGKTVVSMYDVGAYMLYFQREKPFFRYGESLSPTDFVEKYPYPVTSVEVQKGAKKEKAPVRTGLHTDGKVVVCVHSVVGGKVNYTSEIPFRKKDQTITEAAFLKKFPYRLDAVELE